MAKELIYKVRIDYDSSDLVSGSDRGSDAQEELQKELEQTRLKLRQLKEEQDDTTNTTRNYSRAQSNANQVLFSYGDLLNDAQQFQFGFSNGLRAIGNNVGFAAEGIANLNQRAGGFRGTLSALGSSLLGPGGIILAINLAVTAFTVFGDQLFRSSEGAEDLEAELEALNTQVQTTVSLIEQITDTDDPFGIESLRFELRALGEEESVLETQLERLQEVESQIGNIRFAIREARQEAGQRGRLADVDAELERISELQKIRDQIVKDFGTQSDLEEKIADLEENRSEILTQLESKQQGLNSATAQEFRARQELFEQTKARAEEDIIIPADIQIDTEGLRQQIQQARTILQDPGLQEGITLQTTLGGEISPEEQAANEERRRQFEERRNQLNELAERTAPKVSRSLNEVALQGVEAGESIGKGFDKVGQVISRAGAQAIITAKNIQQAGRAIINTVISEIVAYAIRSAIRDIPFPENILAAAGAAAAGKGLAELIPDPSSNNLGSSGRGSGGGNFGTSVNSVTRAPTTTRSTSIRGVSSRSQKQVQPIVIQGDINTVATAFKVREGEAQIRKQQRQ